MEWIDIREKKPPIGKSVLIARIKGSMSGYNYIDPWVSRMSENGTFSGCMDWVSATHWMELPDNPKKIPSDD